MRRAVLLRSVRGVLGEHVSVFNAAYMWNRHRWFVPYAVLVFAVLAWIAPIAGVEDWPTRIVIGIAGSAIAVNASSGYRVLAETDQGIFILQASRIRQVATGKLDELPSGAILEPAGGTMLATDWKVGDQIYTVARSSEQAMERMARKHLPGTDRGDPRT